MIKAMNDFNSEKAGEYKVSEEHSQSRMQGLSGFEDLTEAAMLPELSGDHSDFRLYRCS